MNIAMISSPHVPVPPPKYGGTERVIYYLIKGLTEAGHHVTTFATGDSKIPGELVPITPHALYFGADTTEQKIIRDKVEEIHQHTIELVKSRAEEFDIIHSHGLDMLELAEYPTVTTLHGSFTLERMDYFEQRKHLHYITISQNQQEPAPDLQYAGVAYNGLNTLDFPVMLEPENYVCFLGRFDREKNPHLAIELAKEIGVPIKLAGKIDFLGKEYFAEEIEPHLQDPDVEYLGELGMEEKIQLISQAKANLHPTNFREPFGLTVIESAYCGTPTVAITRGSMTEIIEDGRSGILVEDFVEAYHRMDECFELDRNYIANRSRLLFNYRTMTQQYLKAYTHVLQEWEAQLLLRDEAFIRGDNSQASSG